MKTKMQVGETAYFHGVRVKCHESELLGKRRCTECAFEEYPEVCCFVRCWPTKKTRINYVIVGKKVRGYQY